MLGASSSISYRSRSPLPLLVILLAYLGIGSLFALNTPPWQAPDEPAHYNYVRQLATGTWPVIEFADYDERYRAKAVSSGFAPEYPIEPLTYEDWQPPLYYVLLVPVFLLTDGALLPLRFTSLLFGLGVIIATYAVASHVWPDRRGPVVIATGFVAFLPQHLAILSSVNNDSLSELIVALLLWSLAAIIFLHGRQSRISWRRCISLGLLLGLGFLTKLTVYIMAPVTVIAVALLFWRRWSVLARSLLFILVPSLALGAVLWVRNLLVYERLDPLATMAHDAVVVGQPRTVEWIASYGASATAGRFLATTFRSFWGQFGWMGVLMDARIYQLLLLFSIAVFAGLLWSLLRRGNPRTRPRTGTRQLALVLFLTFSFNVLLYLVYNLTFVQHQGRYLFAALIPIAVAVAVGIDSWLSLVAGRWRMAVTLAPAILIVALVGLDLVALFRFIVPQLGAH